MPGRFITLEGGEGSGKSTLARGLASALPGPVVLTREPGGSPGAEEIRALLVNGQPGRWSAVSESLLLFAARRDHVERTIGPALREGAFVICDRFVDSTYAYQCVGRGLALSDIETLSRFIEAPTPDLTFILDVDPAIGLARARGRGGNEGRYESMDFAFHQTVREAFLAVAAREPARCVTLDATRSSEAVLADALTAIGARWPHGR